MPAIPIQRVSNRSSPKFKTAHSTLARRISRLAFIDEISRNTRAMTIDGGIASKEKRCTVVTRGVSAPVNWPRSKNRRIRGPENTHSARYHRNGHR